MRPLTLKMVNQIFESLPHAYRKSGIAYPMHQEQGARGFGKIGCLVCYFKLLVCKELLRSGTQGVSAMWLASCGLSL